MTIICAGRCKGMLQLGIPSIYWHLFITYEDLVMAEILKACVHYAFLKAFSSGARLLSCPLMISFTQKKNETKNEQQH